MHRIEFLSVVALEKVVCNRKKDTDAHSLNRLQMHWLRFEKGSPFSINFKETFNDLVEFRQIDLRKHRPGRNVPQSLASVEQVPLYPSRRPISEAKKNDMPALLPYISSVHHKYFKSLPVSSSTRSQMVSQDAETDNETTVFV
ncbi:hypothetical protein PR048_021182 [Dryococelus australis]|uniref:Uncharacterized protein n=1 Tax=Dryococelus australis TaxID=614101 RepID=A0ABQ9GXG7_9NEOP|nr:hypothetical protein PR048_021182 [Dryococelus australis]